MVYGTGAARDRAITSVAFESLVVVDVLVLAVVTTAIVGRSMVRPLRRLQAGARDVAERRLPEAVRRIGEGSDEGRIAFTVQQRYEIGAGMIELNLPVLL